ncbi:AarF/UbiB family protein [Oleiphilus sp. HI0086]|uniref:AarF/UbiB family protein n=4 Tax=unclassified Oleiphilus TaxID=2631174 RepID=UPI0008385151|nr:AarF/UbiB family protein [Oleiphilus sp. HI0086]
MSKPKMPKEKKRFLDIPSIKDSTFSVFKGAGDLATSSVALPKAFVPIVKLLMTERMITQDELADELDLLFEQLYLHPVSSHSRSLTEYLRKYRIIPNEESTENLIGYVVKQAVLRSPVDIPEVVVDEFWSFFQELIESPELKGVVELNLDIVRSVLRTYEPLLLDIVNSIKHIRKINQKTLSEIVLKLQVLRGDIHILKRQIKAIRYIKPFLQTDPKDFKQQAEIVAKMVREFGPLFIKMAQVAAANSDFLPEEISKELKVFQEDVDPMTASEVYQAFNEEFGQKPESRYFGFDVNNPIKSGSIGSVFVAKKPMQHGDEEVLVPVVVKVARHNLEREFAMGSLAIELMLISSQYWAPHSKLRPFLAAMSEQIKEFTKGFEQELDFKHEAEIQDRFYQRALASPVWYVPGLYGATGRIIEMEFLQDAMAINQAIDRYRGKRKKKFQRKLADNFLYTMLEHLLIHQEFHGDLHPGNVMVDLDARLFLIDWGNAVDMRGKWGMVGRYLASVLSGDVDMLTMTLIQMSKGQKGNLERYDEIKTALEETLFKKNVTPLGRDFMFRLYEEGQEGLRQRLQTALHLMSNTYQLDMTIKSDYLHLSRSLFAMVGTYNNLYKDISGWTMAKDLVADVAMFPLRFTYHRIVRPNILSEPEDSPYATNHFAAQEQLKSKTAPVAPMSLLEIQ